MENEKNTDIQSMSTDELRDFINKENGIPVNSDENTEPSTDNVENETVQNENETVEETDTVEVKPEESTNNEKPFYKGKSRDQLIDMQENATKKISQQENYLKKLEQEIEAIKNNQNQVMQNKKVAEEEDDDFLERYDKDDVEAILKLVDRKLQSREKQQIKQTEEQKKANFSENDIQFRAMQDALALSDMDLFNEFNVRVNKELLEKGREKTADKKGWFNNFATKTLNEIKKNKANSETLVAEKKQKLVSRKINASSIPTTTTGSQSSSWKGKPEPKGAEDYRKWLVENAGIKL
tara:strand:+ start:185 stop:1069 length:885 start_codon:yes stop_codon:yes gene_type:complete